MAYPTICNKSLYNTPTIYNAAGGVYNSRGVYNDGAGGGFGDFIGYNDFSQENFSSIIGETTAFNPNFEQVNESYFVGKKSGKVKTNENLYFRINLLENTNNELTEEFILKILGGDSNNYCTEFGHNNGIRLESFYSYGDFLRLQVRADSVTYYNSSKLNYITHASPHFYYKVLNSLNAYIHIAEELQYKIDENRTYGKIFLNGQRVIEYYFGGIFNIPNCTISRENNYIETIYSMYSARKKLVSVNNVFPVPTQPYF